MENPNKNLFDCQRMFRHACAFSDCADFALKEFRPDIVDVAWYTTPAIVNSAFACEVFLKTLILFHGITRNFTNFFLRTQKSRLKKQP